MTVDQAAQKWQCSPTTIRRYCRTGMIREAEKRGTGWMIPDDAIKPLLTRHRACLLMTDMLTTAEGAKPARRYTMEECQYLADAGFITDISSLTNLEQVLSYAKPTSTGTSLIASENALTVEGTLSIDLGIIKGQISMK